MRNLSLLIGILSLIPFSGFTQLSNGSMAPDFTITDIDGVTHSLYADYLDQGISVVLDLSATWCPPCWTYHNNGVMEQVYNEYGPNSNDFLVMPMMIESDPGTNMDCFFGQAGCNDVSLGDYSGHPYPLCNPPSAEASVIASDYQIAFFPSIYVIAPSGYVQLSPLLANTTYNFLESWAAESFQMENSTWTVFDNDCGPGSIDFNTFQGFGSVSYNWSNGATTEDINGLNTGDYSVTLTDSNGYTVEFGPISVIGEEEISIDAATLTNVDCNGLATGAISITTTGGSGNFSYDWSNGTNDGPSIDNLIADDYEVTITDQDTDCELTQTYQLTEPEPLLVDMNIVNAGCGGVSGEITLNVTGGVAPYSFIINGTSYNQNTITLTTGNYNVQTIDANNCTSTEAFAITQLPLPVSISAVSGVIDCSEPTVTLNSSGSSTGSAISYAWYDDDGDFITNDPQYQTNTEGTYTLYVIDNNTNCENSSKVTVINNAVIPPAIITPSGILTCNNSTITLSAAGSASGPDISYRWSDNNGGNIVGSNTGQTVTVNSAGDYTLLVEDDSNSCENEISISLTAPTPPALSLPSPINFCEGNPTQVCANFSPTQSIQWLQNGNIVSTNACLEVTTTSMYTAQLTDNTTGCTSQQNIATNSMSLPSSLIIGDLDICKGGSTDLCHANQANIDYTWTFDGVPITATSSCLTINQTGQIQLSASNSQTGCHTSQVVNVNVGEIPVAELLTPNGTEINCDTGTVLLDLITTTNVTISWRNNAGLIISTDEDIFVTAGTYTYTVQSAGGCQTQGSITITEDNELPNLTLSQPEILTCHINSVTLGFNTTSNKFTLEWIDANGNSLTGQNPIVSSPGIYTAKLQDENGCRVQASVNVVEDIQAPDISIAFEDPMEFDCNTSSVAIQLEGTTSDQGFIWTNDQGVEIGNEADLTVTKPGTYQVAVTGSNGCTATSTIMIQANSELPEINIIPPALLGCASSVVLQLEGDLDGNDIVWLDPTGISIGTTSTITVDQSGTYTAQVITPGGCMATSTITVADNNAELVQAAFTAEINLSEINLTSTSVASGNTTYLWDFGDGNTSSEEDVIHLYDTAGEYEVCLTTTNECGGTTVCQTIMAIAALNYSTEVQDISCPNGTDGRIIITMTGGTPMYTYNWSDTSISGMGSAGLSAGDYQVTVTDESGQTITINVTLEEPTPIVSEATILPTSMAEANGQISLEITGGTPPYEVIWDDGSEGLERAGLEQGNYMAVITDDNGCQIVSTFTVAGSTAITEIFSLTKFTLSPNPATNAVQVDATFSEKLSLDISLINARGEKLFKNKIETETLSRQIDLTDYPSGIYLIELRSGQQVSYKKLVVTK